MKNKINKTAVGGTKTTAGDSTVVIVSACLLGLPTRYDGRSSENNELIKKLAGGVIIALCPEELGGLPTPRLPAEIIGYGGGSGVLNSTACVKSSCGTDVTANFIRGAKEVLRIALLNKVTRAYLKEKSPSCGVNIIKKDGKDCAGRGVTTALLEKNNIETFSIS